MYHTFGMTQSMAPSIGIVHEKSHHLFSVFRLLQCESPRWLDVGSSHGDNGKDGLGLSPLLSLLYAVTLA
jgi:hypothetical protein